MAFTTKKETTFSLFSSIKKYILPAYIIISAVFILYVICMYLVGVVYQSGMQAGKEQALQAGQEQGYIAALQQLSDEFTKGTCEVVTLTLGEKQVNVINVDCLQNTQTQAPGELDAMISDEDTSIQE